MAIFIAVMAFAFAFAGVFTPMQTGGFVTAVVLAFVETLMLLLLRSLYLTKYILTEQELAIETTRLIVGQQDSITRNRIGRENLDTLRG